MTPTPKPTEMSLTPTLDRVLRMCEEERASSWPPLSSDRQRIVRDARAELQALRERVKRLEADAADFDRTADLVRAQQLSLTERDRLTRLEDACRRALGNVEPSIGGPHSDEDCLEEIERILRTALEPQ